MVDNRRHAGGDSPVALVAPLIRDEPAPLALARALADQSADAMLLCDAAGKVIHANPVAVELFSSGGNADALGGRDLRVLVPGCPADLRPDGSARSWRARVIVAGEGLAELDVRLRALDLPRSSILALVATRRPPAPHDNADADAGRWALAAQGSTDGFWHRPDVGLDTAWWSPRLYQILGYQPGELEPCFSALVQRLHPDDRHRYLATRERNLLNDDPFDIEVRVRHRSGEYRHLRVRALVTRHRDGRPVSLSGSMQDVTELHRARTALETNQSRMRDFAAAASDFFFEMDEHLTITWLSDNFTQVTGIDRDALLGRSVAERLPTDPPDEQWDHYVSTLRRHAPFRDMVRSRELADGQVIHGSLSGYPVFDADGHFRGYRGSGTDVTARVTMENALRESEEKYRTIVETDQDAVLLIDAGTMGIVDGNNAASGLYGMPGRSILGVDLAALAADPDEGRTFLRHLHDAGVAVRHRMTHRHADGHLIPVEVSARRVRLSGRDAFVCMVHDVSERERTLQALERSEARFKALVENAPFEIFLKDREGRFVLANSSVARAWGRDVSDILGRTAYDIFPGALAAEVAGEDALVLRENAPLSHVRHLERDGGMVDMFCVKFPIPDASGQPSGIGSIALDITQQNRALKALETSERRFRDFAEQAADYLWESDQNLVFTFVSERCLEVNGVPPEAVIGRHMGRVFDDTYDDEERHLQLRAGIDARRAFEAECTRVRPDGTSARIYVSGNPIFDDEGAFLGYRGITRDITESHELAARLAYQATHDALTGLVNRPEFERRLERMLESARRDGTSHALCYLDLDQFKVVNDTCGHMAGDALLERLSETLTFRVRQRDTVARLGGDEFAILIEHCSLEQATRVASTLHEAISDFAFVWEDKQFQVGASVGVVAITPDLGDATDVLAAADSACYVAKEQGRNRIHVYAKDDTELARRRGEMDWVSHISGALAENRFRLRSQPVVPLAPRRAGAHHCELLLVMIDRDGNEIAPGAFLPAAERYNLATRIDRWVVREALTWLSNGSPERGRPALCGINLSAQSLGEGGFLDFVRGECTRLDVPASRLCFEITETAAIANLDTARRFIDALRGDGARFALDDFGKGLSSFGYLRALPVDYIKIDAQFVRDLLTDPIDLAMVRSINEVARLMEKRTIAEGVESHDILAKLREVGVDYAQGFAIGMPRFID